MINRYEKNEKDEQAEIIKAFFPDDPDLMINYISDFRELMMKYNAAIREIQTKLEILNDELSLNNRHSPIENITSRIKKPMSIAKKLKDLDKEITLESIVENLNDVAGIRVICSFVDDIYKVAKMLASQDDITVIKVKDYIKNPKPNGYRSYHMIVEVPVFFSDSKQPMRAEVQIRTIAMDFWASLEHKIYYKYNKEVPAELIGELKEAADSVSQLDEKMANINRKISRYKENDDSDDGLLELLINNEKFNIPQDFVTQFITLYE